MYEIKSIQLPVCYMCDICCVTMFRQIYIPWSVACVSNSVEEKRRGDEERRGTREARAGGLRQRTLLWCVKDT